MLDDEPEDCTTIATWNVNGIQSCADKGAFQPYVRAEDATILVITETNCKGNFLNIKNNEKLLFLKELYHYSYWTHLLLVCTKVKPLQVIEGFPMTTEQASHLSQDECKQRCITLEYEAVYLVAAYVPYTGSDWPRRNAWNEAFGAHIRKLDTLKPVIWVGDFNVVEVLDTSRNLERENRRPSGASDEERKAHRALLDPPPGSKPWRKPYHRFVDVWRLMNPEERDGFTHRTERYGSWRLDGFIVSERYLANVRKCKPRPEIHEKYNASDHWPVWMSLEVAPNEL